jgi:phage N-6-adenine-methyltransferase
VTIIEETPRIGHEPVQKPGRSKQDYGTPIEFIRACEERFGPFVCDLAASDENTKARAWYTRERDSLAQPWHTDYPNGTLWLNPEFADIDPWAAKCALESTRRFGLILLLTPASIGCNWFADHVKGKAIVLGVSPRLTFEGTTAPYPKDLMLSVFGYGLSGFDTWRWR